MNQSLNSPLDKTLIPQNCEIESVEEEEVIFSITGQDTSGVNRTLAFQIRSLPHHGFLYDQHDESLGIGSVIANGTGLKFIGSKDFFNEPYSITHPPPDNYFFFSAILQLEGGAYISSLSLAKVTIKVINVNDPPILVIPFGVKQVDKFSSLSWNKDCSRGNVSTKCKSKLIIDHIEIKDVDGHMDYVRLDITSSHGILTLNEDSLMKASFANCSNRSKTDLSEVSWNCNGTGLGDREVSTFCFDFSHIIYNFHIVNVSFPNVCGRQNQMTFVAQTLDLDDILANFTYESLVVGTDDIIFTIHDGEGGECLSSVEHAQIYRNNAYMGKPSIHRRCTSVVRSQSIKVLHGSQSANMQRRTIPMQVTVAIALAAFVFLLLAVIFPIRRLMKAYRESQVAPPGVRQNRKKKRKLSSSKEKKLKKDSAQKKEENANITKEDAKENKARKEESKKETKAAKERKRIENKKSKETKIKKDERKPVSASAESVKLNHDREKEDETTESDSDYNIDNTAEWIQYFDESSGDFYYENTLTRRVTWTEPKQYINGEDNKSKETKIKKDERKPVSASAESVKFYKKHDREKEYIDETTESDSDYNIDKTAEWIQYSDESSGDFYYENTLTRRVTWTEPKKYINGEEEN